MFRCGTTGNYNPKGDAWYMTCLSTIQSRNNLLKTENPINYTLLFFLLFYCSEFDKFDIYGCGLSLLSNFDTRSEIEDKIHFFTEECDSLQVRS